MMKAKNFEMKKGPKLQVTLEATGSAGECGNSRKMSWTHSKDRKDKYNDKHMETTTDKHKNDG